MLHHVSVGVRSVEAATRFYDAVLGTLGYKRVMEFLPYAVAYGDRTPQFWVQLPADRNPASVGNGVHIGFAARSKTAIEAFHRAALGAGGTDEGGAGPRPDYGPDYFGAFVRDPDGNKLEACLAPEPRRTAAQGKRKKTAAKKKKKANAANAKTSRRGKAAKRRKAKRR